MTPKLAATAGGALVGGMIGAFSDKRSVLGGMAMGAMGGRVGLAGIRHAGLAGNFAKSFLESNLPISAATQAMGKYATMKAGQALNGIKGFYSQVGRAWNLGAGRY
jgi:hypothetical protein